MFLLYRIWAFGIRILYSKNILYDGVVDVNGFDRLYL